MDEKSRRRLRLLQIVEQSEAAVLDAQRKKCEREQKRKRNDIESDDGLFELEPG